MHFVNNYFICKYYKMDNNFMIIILAFILGYMVNSMCGGRLVEGGTFGGDGNACDPVGGHFDDDCGPGLEAATCESQEAQDHCWNACGQGDSVCISSSW